MYVALSFSSICDVLIFVKRDQFIAELTKIAQADERVVLITGDLGFGVLNDYREKLPRQFINAGVAEQAMAGIGNRQCRYTRQYAIAKGNDNEPWQVAMARGKRKTL
mgnify:CR=1 FL=1